MEDDRVVSCCFVWSESPSHQPIVLNWIINPLIDIPTDASDVHGITTEMAVRDGIHPKEALTDIAEKLSTIMSQGHVISAYNCTFDLSLLVNEFTRWGIPFNPDFSRVLDPLVIDKAIDKYRRGSRKLIDVSAHYGYTLQGAHEAEADVFACIAILRSMSSKFKESITIEELQLLQKSAKLEQATSLQAYLRKKENDDTIVISTEWPYQTKAVND